MESMTGYTFTPFMIYFTSERLIIAHGKKGPTAFSVSSERHWQSGVKECFNTLLIKWTVKLFFKCVWYLSRQYVDNVRVS